MYYTELKARIVYLWRQYLSGGQDTVRRMCATSGSSQFFIGGLQFHGLQVKRAIHGLACRRPSAIQP